MRSCCERREEDGAESRDEAASLVPPPTFYTNSSSISHLSPLTSHLSPLELHHSTTSVHTPLPPPLPFTTRLTSLLPLPLVRVFCAVAAMPSRHSRNNSAGAVFTYRERQRTAWGTRSQRLGSESITPFDYCHICLHTAQQPLSCHKGHLYCRACILESLALQTERHKREQREREDGRQRRRAEVERKEGERAEGEARRFLSAADSIHSAHVFTCSSASSSTSSPSSSQWVGYEELSTRGGVAYVVSDCAAQSLLPPSATVGAASADLHRSPLPLFCLPLAAQPLRPSTHSDASSGAALLGEGPKRAAVLPCFWIPSVGAAAHPPSRVHAALTQPTLTPAISDRPPSGAACALS